MYLMLAGPAPELRDRDDFRAFKIVVDAATPDLDRVRTAFRGLAEFEDADTAWVSAPALRALGPAGGDEAWRAGLDGMIEKARPHGWVHPRTGAVRAHVEWLRATSP